MYLISATFSLVVALWFKPRPRGPAHAHSLIIKVEKVT
jgi:hypothetical protein